VNGASVPALRVSEVVKDYSSKPPLRALDGVSFDIEQGEFFGLLGPNGAGKTTLISIIAGLARPTTGHAEVMGHDAVSDAREARMRLGVVPQELTFDPFFTVRETLRITSGYYGVRSTGPGGNAAWIDEILFELDLESKAGTNMRALSGGMKRRVLVAQALVHRPPVIVLDEPTAGVDVELRQTLWRFMRRLNREGHTLILTTHYLEEAEDNCTRIAMLKRGRIVALDRTANLLSRVSGVRLVARLAGPALPDSLAALATEAGGGRTAIRLQGHADVEPTLALLRTSGIAIEDLDLERADLEDAFMQLTGDTAGAS
jgi:ABC-2 type transport system ATP-binding protein